jgi:DNA-binding PadR family transcriptional regulator
MTSGVPLKLQHFHILLALADGDRHGFGIQREVRRRTDGDLQLWPAMLYRSLNRLREEGLVTIVDPPTAEPVDERRQYYRLTPAGRRCLKREARRLAVWAGSALDRDLLEDV